MLKQYLTHEELISDAVVPLNYPNVNRQVPTIDDIERESETQRGTAHPKTFIDEVMTQIRLLRSYNMNTYGVLKQVLDN